MTLVLLVITVAARVIPALDCIAIIVRVQSRNCVFAYVNLFCIFRHLLSVRLYYVPYLRYRSIANTCFCTANAAAIITSLNKNVPTGSDLKVFIYHLQAVRTKNFILSKKQKVY